MFWMGETCVREEKTSVSARLSTAGCRGEREREVGRGDTYDQIADENLKDLGFQAGPAFEEFLQDGDQDMTQWSADEGAVESHLGYARAEVVAVFTAIVGDP